MTKQEERYHKGLLSTYTHTRACFMFTLHWLTYSHRQFRDCFAHTQQDVTSQLHVPTPQLTWFLDRQSCTTTALKPWYHIVRNSCTVQISHNPHESITITFSQPEAWASNSSTFWPYLWMRRALNEASIYLLKTLFCSSFLQSHLWTIYSSQLCCNISLKLLLEHSTITLFTLTV